MDNTPISLLKRLGQPAGDPTADQAWRHFVRLYTPLLYSWARRFGIPADQADDFVQDIFIVLVNKLPEFVYDPQKRFRGWLWTIALNRYREQRRRIATRPPMTADRLDDLADVVDPNPPEEAEYRQFLARRALAIMQADFAPATWKAFWECVAEGRPAAEVAAQLGLTIGAVYAAKFRVLCRLRSELEGLLD